MTSHLFNFQYPEGFQIILLAPCEVFVSVM